MRVQCPLSLGCGGLEGFNGVSCSIYTYEVCDTVEMCVEMFVLRQLATALLFKRGRGWMDVMV